MAVINFIKRWQDRGATDDEKGNTELRRGWIVETNADATDAPEVINALVGFDPSAAMFAPHPSFPRALLRKRSCDPHTSARQWLVKAEYSSAPFEAKGDGTQLRPDGSPQTPADQSHVIPADQRPFTISIARKEVTKPLEFDVVTEEDIVNTVGDPFDPPIEVFRSHHIITWKFKKKPQDLNWPFRSAYLDSVNDAEFQLFGRTYEPFSLRCIAYDLDTEWDTGPDNSLILYMALTVQAEFDPDGWKLMTLNTGRRKQVGSQFDPDNPVRKVAIVDEQGQPVADPVPLDATGVPVLPGGAFKHVENDGYIPKNWQFLLS